MSLVGKFAHTKLAKDCFSPDFTVITVEFVSGICGVNLILNIRGSSESPVESRLRVTVRHQIRYSRSAQSANTRRSGAAGPKHNVVGMLVPRKLATNAESLGFKRDIFIEMPG